MGECRGIGSWEHCMTLGARQTGSSISKQMSCFISKYLCKKQTPPALLILWMERARGEDEDSKGEQHKAFNQK